ncbi:MAG: hypothetical protein KGI37_02005 [Alphaproteobacteria bacterium]|nr:hypothetical protein [Alphaproteobacteria bacterium]
MNKPFIVVGTPCFGGMVSQDYTMSLLNVQAASAREGFDLATLLLGNDALITRGRSAIVAKFMDAPQATHLLFVDADITFSVEQVVRLLKADKDFVAGMYPAKIIDWTQLAQRFGRTPESLDEAGLAYVGALCEGADARRENGFATGIYAGTGFQLIKRGVFERMFAAYPETKYQALHAFPRPAKPSDHLYALFDCMIDPDTGVYLSEDYAFCRRWRAIGGEIWLDLDSKLVHTGPYSFRGNAGPRFQRGAV